MSGTSSKSKVIGVRLSNDVLRRIEKALASPNNNNTSVSDYCKVVLTRWVYRHDKKKGV